MNNWAKPKDINDIDFLLEFYHRVKSGKIIVKSIKWEKKSWNKIRKQHVCFISDKDKRVFLISHKSEGTKFYTNFNDEYSHLLP